MTIVPQPGPQTQFLECTADIALFGGAAGGGKSYALLLEASRFTEERGFGGVIFRRTLADVKKQGSLWDSSINVYGPLAKPRLDTLSWTFPARTKITFGHLEHETDVLTWQGAQVPFIGFDELTHFTRHQFFYMLSRNRLGAGCTVRPYVRATTNPDADSWVAEFIEWWIDQDTGFAIVERSGVIRWFARIGDDGIKWADTKEELQVRHPGCQPKSFTFILSKLEDNQILMQADPGYLANLMAQDRVERERLLNGNWKIKPSSGMYFQRQWCEIVDSIPAGTKFVRGWDIAATKKTEQNDPDWTVGTKIGKIPPAAGGGYLIADHRRAREAPAGVEKLVHDTAVEDGQEVRIHMPQDPAAAGKAQVEVYRKKLAGFNVRFAIASGDKITRFGGFSAQADPGPGGGKGRVKILRGKWNDVLFAQLETFPEGRHDDDADATSEAFNGLEGKYGKGEALLEVVTGRATAKTVPEAEKIEKTYAVGSVEHGQKDAA